MVQAKPINFISLYWNKILLLKFWRKISIKGLQNRARIDENWWNDQAGYWTYLYWNSWFRKILESQISDTYIEKIECESHGSEVGPMKIVSGSRGSEKPIENIKCNSWKNWDSKPLLRGYTQKDRIQDLTFRGCSCKIWAWWESRFRGSSQESKSRDNFQRNRKWMPVASYWMEL